MKIHPAPQHSLEWLVARAGVVTASEFSELVDSEFELRKGVMPHALLCKKLAERWRGGPLPGFMSVDMDIGAMLEDEAKPYASFALGLDIQSVGLITTDDGRIGASPDGLIGEDSGIEIKCPRTENHIRYLLANEVPKDYAAQVHGALLVTERPRWKFMSYARGLPALVVDVERDVEILDKLAGALSIFLSRLDTAWEKLCNLNGGPPQRRKSEPVTVSEQSLDESDVPH